MRKALFSTILVVLCSFVYITSSAQNVNWLKQMGYNRTRGSFSKIVLDKDANIIQNFQSDYWNPVIETDTVTVKTQNSVVLAKYDSVGNYLWSRAITGPTWGTYSGGVAADKSGNIYVCGWTFSDTLYFSPTDYTVTGYQNGASGYLAKYSPAGQVLWRKVFPAGTDTLNSQPYSIMVDNNDDIVVSGKFFWNTSFGDTAIRGTFCNMFLAKYATSGVRKWIRIGKGNTGFNWFGKLACDSANNIYATGKKGGEINFGGGFIIPQDTGIEKLVITKFSSTGIPQWYLTRRGKITPGYFPDRQGNYGTSIATDGLGNVYATGSLLDSFSANPNASSGLGYDYYQRIFIIKLRPDGSVIWENTPNGGISAEGKEILVDKCSSPYMTASYNGSVTLGAHTLPVTNTMQAYVAKLDSASGNPLWVTASTGTETHADGLVINNVSGTLINAASYRSAITWGTKTANFVPYSVPVMRNYLLGSIANVVNCPPKQTPSSVNAVKSGDIAAVYPNPAWSTLFVKSQESGISLKLMDVTGKTICKTITTGELTSIDVSRLKAGIYYMQLTTKNGNTQVLKQVIGL